MVLTKEDIEKITKGAEFIDEIGGYFSFSRFMPLESRAFEGDENLFYKTLATAGVKFDFITDSDIIAFDYLFIRASSRSFAFFSVFIDGNPFLVCGSENVTEDREAHFEETLPKGKKRVTVYFPNLFCMMVKNVTLNGSFERVESKVRMVSYGDSITQGYDAILPQNSYVNRVASMLDAEVFNKAVGADYFNPAAVQKPSAKTDIVTVAYGTNDFSRHTREQFMTDMPQFFKRIHDFYSDAKIFVITPLWRRDHEEKKVFDGTFFDLCGLIEEECKRYPEITVIKGFDLVPHHEMLFSDKYLHPNDIGMEMYADNLIKHIHRK